MLPIHHSKQYRKSYKRLARSGAFDSVEVNKVINTLASGKKLSEAYKDRSLSGGFLGYRECHIRPDLVIIYKLIEGELLVITDIGSHSEMFS